MCYELNWSTNIFYVHHHDSPWMHHIEGIANIEYSSNYAGEQKAHQNRVSNETFAESMEEWYGKREHV